MFSYRKLIEFRKAKAMSQAQLSEATGLSQSAIALWEQGKRDPGFTAVQKLSVVLGCTCIDFIETPPPQKKKK